MPIIINTPQKREDMIPKLNGYKGRVYAIDARHISVETLGKNFPEFTDVSSYGSGQ